MTYYKIDGMVCSQCDAIVGRIASKHLKTFKRTFMGDYALTYDKAEDLDHFKEALNQKGYHLTVSNRTVFLLSLVGLVALYFLMFSIYNRVYVTVDQSAGYGLILLFGGITAFHCISMCGGISIGIGAMSPKPLKDVLAYNLARVVGYATIGGLLGAIGKFFTLSRYFSGLIILGLGLMMALTAIRLWLNLPMPALFSKFTQGIRAHAHHSEFPIIIGFLNAFMPCGPLQTIYLIALASGSPLIGATSMLIFGLATMITMVPIGLIEKWLPKLPPRQVALLSATLLMLISIATIQRGITQAGFTMTVTDVSSFTEKKQPIDQETPISYAPLVDGHQIVNLMVNRTYILEKTRVKKDIPVRLIITTKAINGCIDTITIPEYGVSLGLYENQTQEIIFTPTQAGQVIITCWMSMVTQYLTVE